MNRLFPCLLFSAWFSASAAETVAFQTDDHLCIVGNSLADRMQHDGWLETLLQAQNPGKRMVIRNLGYSGDQVASRPRIEGSPTLEDHLALCKANVLFCFFGYNESFAGAEGIPSFKQNYIRWIQRIQKSTFHGKSAPRLVLFTPIASEEQNGSLLPRAAESNERLALYARAIEEVATKTDSTFVDIFTPTKALFEKTATPRTLNGVHLTDEGNRLLAEIIATALSGTPIQADASLEKLRQAILDKNARWHNRYRAVDGNDIWGNRSVLTFVNGQSNADVLQPELIQLDVMTANRDRRIWALAEGHDIQIDDSNVPPPVEVISNVGGRSNSSSAMKEGTEEYLSPQDSMARLKPAQGFSLNLFADEQRFPELVNPVQMSVDTKGRLWVAAWKTYPMSTPTEIADDRLLLLPDDDGDGVADRCITFARVPNPTGFEFWNGGVLVASAPDILFLKDTDGDDVADVCIRLVQGIEAADTHHAANSFVYGPDGAIYWQRGVFIVENVETPWGPALPAKRAGIYRFDPLTFQFHLHAAFGPNPHGMAFDRWGYHFATDGTSGDPWQIIPSEQGFRAHSPFTRTVRPVPASGIISSTHFPPENQQNFLICNVIGFLGIKQYRMERDSSTGIAKGIEQENLLVSTDRNFRPTAIQFGADGALYIADWQNRIIGHMQHNVRDPSRDHRHGRIYRMTAKGRPLQEPVAIAGAPLDRLMRNLEHPVDGVRYRTRIELSARDPKAVLAACQKWMAGFDASKMEDAHSLLEALWLHQRLHIKNRPLLEQLLNSPEPHARQAARVVQQAWNSDGLPPAPEAEEPVETVAHYGPTRPLRAEEQAIYDLGREVYHRDAHCVTCHQADGKGLPNLYPPLVASTWIDGDDHRFAKAVLKGLWGPIEVNGVRYDPAGGGIPPMIGFADLLSDQEIAAVLSFVNLSYENHGDIVSPELVKKIREETRGQSTFYSPEELLKTHPLRPR